MLIFNRSKVLTDDYARETFSKACRLIESITATGKFSSDKQQLLSLCTFLLFSHCKPAVDHISELSLTIDHTLLSGFNC